MTLSNLNSRIYSRYPSLSKLKEIENIMMSKKSNLFKTNESLNNKGYTYLLCITFKILSYYLFSRSYDYPSLKYSLEK